MHHAFGRGRLISQNVGTMSTNSNHQPFAELPIEARALFFIYASAALAVYQSYPPTPRELMPQLETIWDESRFTEGDLSNPYRMTWFLEQCFAPTAPDQPLGTVASVRGRRCRQRA